MSSQLFIYYRIPKTEISAAIQCAQRLMHALHEQGLGHGQLFQREEADKPYFTLMEVIYPNPDHSDSLGTFTTQVELLAANCFADLPSNPGRHIELFSEVNG